MHYTDWGFWGMHVFWWLFWIVVMVVFFLALMPTSRRQSERPLEILQRRYAAGEITTQEYEERKALLERDA
ncbi:MAG: SHOCT domain-containing protein [Gammaproteobacteria bacterium]|nr:SHOCT domain-containing protein [Gammaproteobacteria bacterium]